MRRYTRFLRHHKKKVSALYLMQRNRQHLCEDGGPNDFREAARTRIVFGKTRPPYEGGESFNK